MGEFITSGMQAQMNVECMEFLSRPPYFRKEFYTFFVFLSCLSWQIDHIEQLDHKTNIQIWHSVHVRKKCIYWAKECSIPLCASIPLDSTSKIEFTLNIVCIMHWTFQSQLVMFCLRFIYFYFACIVYMYAVLYAHN